MNVHLPPGRKGGNEPHNYFKKHNFLRAVLIGNESRTCSARFGEFKNQNLSISQAFENTCTDFITSAPQAPTQCTDELKSLETHIYIYMKIMGFRVASTAKEAATRCYSCQHQAGGSSNEPALAGTHFVVPLFTRAATTA